MEGKSWNYQLSQIQSTMLTMFAKADFQGDFDVVTL